MDDFLQPRGFQLSIRQWRISALMIFIEVPSFTASIIKLMSDEEYAGLQEALVDYPDLGKLIPGGGGLRKVRWRLGRVGKRGGVRIIYYFLSSDRQIFMVAAYSKAKKKDLAPHELARLRTITKVMLDG